MLSGTDQLLPLAALPRQPLIWKTVMQHRGRLQGFELSSGSVKVARIDWQQDKVLCSTSGQSWHFRRSGWVRWRAWAKVEGSGVVAAYQQRFWPYPHVFGTLQLGDKKLDLYHPLLALWPLQAASWQDASGREVLGLKIKYGLGVGDIEAEATPKAETRDWPDFALLLCFGWYVAYMQSLDGWGGTA